MRPTTYLTLALLCGCGNGGGSGPGADLDVTGSDASDGDAADAHDTDGEELTCDLPEEPGSLEDCDFDMTVSFDHLRGTVLQLQSADGEFCARLERRDDSPFPADSAVLWALANVRIGRQGNVVELDDPDDLCWRVTHHNWEDVARVWTGAIRYDLELTTTGGHGGDETYTLEVFRQGPLDPEDTYCIREGSTPLCESIELFPVEP